MTSSPTSSPPAPRPGFVLSANDVLSLARSGALLLGAGVAQRLLEWAFSTRPILPVVIGAFLLDLWSQRAGARWLPAGTEGSRGRVLRRWLVGLGAGLAVGLSVPLVGVVTGAARAGLGGLAAASVAMGAVRVAAVAFRDELLYRGIPLALTRDHVPAAWAIAFSALLSVAPLALAASAPETLLLASMAGVFYALTWKVGPGGLAAWSAHAGWLFAVEVVQGGPLAVEWRAGRLSGAEISGFPAYVGAAAFTAAAFIAYGRRRDAPT